MYPPPSSLTIPRGQEFQSRWDTSLGIEEYEHTKIKLLLLKISWKILGNNFPQDEVDTTS